MNLSTNEALSNQQLAGLAPSIFATSPWEGMSDRYAFIPTIDIVGRMRSEGFVPVSATQARARVEGKREFTKHLIRFRDVRSGDTPTLQALGGLVPEIILTNSHDGASCYRIDAGVFRMVCINGLVVGDCFGDQIKVRHSGLPDDVIEASYQIVEQFPKVLESAERFSRLRLTAPQQEAFGRAALQIRYEEAAPVSAAQVVRPRRSADVDPTLWNTLNVVQENLIQGGLRGRNTETRRRHTTRSVTGISENSRLNKALWTLTEEMAKLLA
jgi:hypothetical protein